MTRDMHLVRKILLQLEAWPDAIGPTDTDAFTVLGYSDEEVHNHVRLLAEAGLIHATNVAAFQDAVWLPHTLTWQGYDFLDAVRNDTVWQKTMELIKTKVGAVPFDVLQMIATKFLTTTLENPFFPQG